MKRTALAVVLLIVAASVAWAEGPAPEMPTVEALRQPLPTRVGNGGCTMPEDMQALLGSTPPPGMEIGPRSTEGRICEIEIPICRFFEGEADCYDGYFDVYNSGCNDPAEAFTVLPQSFGQPLVVTGRSGTYDGTTRDTDWYEIVLDAPTDISFCVTAEFMFQIALLDGTAGCAGFTIVDLIYDIPECTEACISATVGPGTYWLWVGPALFSGIPCDVDYVMTVHGYEPGPCVLECPPGSVIEEEPVCEFGYDDFYNGGCNFDPWTFQPLDPSGGMIVVCGETGVYEHYTGTCYRDIDWYEITPAEPAEIQFCAAAEFDIETWLLQAGPNPADPCFGSMGLGHEVASACDAACIEAVLDPGRYWLLVSTVNWLPLDCGSEYTMTLTGYTTPVERVSWGTVKAIYR
jgi:hypothetical protein